MKELQHIQNQKCCRQSKSFIFAWNRKPKPIRIYDGNVVGNQNIIFLHGVETHMNEIGFCSRTKSFDMDKGHTLDRNIFFRE